MAEKKRNPQDATRRHDVAPLRRRIEVLEQQVKALILQVQDLLRAVGE